MRLGSRICLTVGLFALPLAGNGEEGKLQIKTYPASTASVLERTREELFLETFKHPSPNIPVNSFVFLVIEGGPRKKVRVFLPQKDKELMLEGSVTLQALAGKVRAELMSSLKNQIDAEGWLRQSVLEQDLETAFNLNRFTFTINVPPEIRGTRVHYLGAAPRDPLLEETVQAASLSGFLNLGGRASRIRGMFEGLPEELEDRYTLDLNGAISWHGLVLESSGLLKSDRDGGRFQRNDIRAVIDRPEQAVRYTFGDLRYPVIGYQTTLTMAGIGVSREFSLQPYVRAYRTGDFEFYLEQPAEIEVWINESRVRTFRLDAGSHDIRGLEPDAGLNDVRLTIEYDSGGFEELEFSFIRDPVLLKKDISIFSLNLGMRRDEVNRDYVYHEDEPLVSAFYQRGLTDSLTAGAYLQADSSSSLFGIEGARGTGLGTVHVDAAAHLSEASPTDFATKISLTRTSGGSRGPKTEWRAQVEYMGENFGSIQTENPFRKDRFIGLAGCTFPVRHGLIGRVSGRYIFMRDGTGPDIYDVSLGFRKKWGRYLNTTVEVRHGEEREGETTEVLAGVSYSRTFGGHHIYAAKERDGDYTAAWDYGKGSSRSTPTAGVSAKSGSGLEVIEGEVGYSGDHFEVEGGHARIESDLNNFPYEEEQTTIALRSAVVFADGVFALSRPIRQNFAIVKGRFGLADTELKINPDGEGRGLAQSSLWGPAVYPDLPLHRVKDVVVVPVNPPFGATPDDTSYAVLSSYKSGVLIEVGKKASKIAIGRLVNEAGRPLAHVNFRYYNLNDIDQAPRHSFSGRMGNFQLTDVESSKYVITPSAESGLQAVIFDVPDTPEDFYNMGDLLLEKR